MARRWKQFRFFREEVVGFDGDDERGSVHRAGLRLQKLLEKRGSGRASGAGWIVVVNSITKELELFEDRLREHLRFRAHNEETCAVWVDHSGVLWCAGWDLPPGRDGLAPSSLKKFNLSNLNGPEMTLRFGRRRRATALHVGFGFAAIGCDGGQVVMLRVDSEGQQDKPRSTNVGGQISAGSTERGQSDGVGRECDVQSVGVLDSGVAVVVTNRSIVQVRYGSKQREELGGEELDLEGSDLPFASCLIEGQVAVARDTTISFYTSDGRGQCLAMPAPQAYVASAGSHLFVLSTGPRGTELVGYDISAQVISHRTDNMSGVMAIFGVAPNTVSIVHQNGSMTRLTLLPASDRVEHLLQRSLFRAAIQLGRRENSRTLSERAVHLYARNLASRGEYDAAAEHLATVASADTDVSWVLMLLAEQKGSRSALRKYLEALLDRGLIRQQHIPLLVSCYQDYRVRPEGTTEEDGEKARRSEDVPASLAEVMRNASAENAERIVEAFRKVGLSDTAEALARQKDLHVQLAKVLAEDRGDADAVLDVMAKLDRKAGTEVAIAVGRWMLGVRPEQFIDASVEVACRANADADQDDELEWSDPMTSKKGAEAALGRTVTTVEVLGDRIFFDSPRWHSRFLESAIGRLAKADRQAIVGSPGGGGGSGDSAAETAVRRLWERLYEVLLVVDSSKGSQSWPPWNTNGDLESSSGSSAKENGTPEAPGNGGVRSEHDQTGNTAVRFLRGVQVSMDRDQLFRLADLFQHSKCLRVLKEQTHSYEALARQLRLEGDRGTLVTLCRRHGDRVPALWLELVHLLAGQDENTDPASTNLEEAIENALKAGAASELEIIDLLCKVAPHRPLSLIRSHFERVIASHKRTFEADSLLCAKLRSELQEIQKERTRLSTGPVIVQLGICESCDTRTTIPAVYFLCGHSYHTRCLPVRECSTCAAVTRGVAEVRMALDDTKNKHDAFLRDLERDGFDAVLRFLERSALR